MYIVKSIEDRDTTVDTVCFNAGEYGSRTERRRWWVVIWDIPTSQGAGVKWPFRNLLTSMKIPSSEEADFLLDHDFLVSLEGKPLPLRHGTGAIHRLNHVWKTVHEEAFCEFDVPCLPPPPPAT